MMRNQHSSPFLPPSASLQFVHSSVIVSESQRGDIDVQFFLAENSAIILSPLLTYASLQLPLNPEKKLLCLKMRAVPAQRISTVI